MHPRRIALLTLIGALAIAGWWQRSTLQQTWRRLTGPALAPTVVVYPLSPAAADPAETSFADGFTQDLAARLGRTPGLTVPARHGMSRLRGRALEYVAKDTDAAAVLTGTLRRSASDVDVSLQLIATSDGAPLWSKDYGGAIEEIFAIETKIANDLGSILGAKAPPGAAAATPAPDRKVDARAYEPYVLGLDALARLRPAEAAEQFEKAIAADADFAEAHAGLVLSLHGVDVEEGVPDDPDRTARRRAAADRAVQLAPDLAQPNLAAGLAAESLDEATASLSRAIEIDPSYAVALQALGDVMIDVDPDRAIAFYGRALTADPYLETSRINQASTLLLLNRWGLTRAELLRTTFEHAPDWGMVMWPVLDLAQGQYMNVYADLVVKTPKLRERSFFLAIYASALAGGGKTAEALEEATSLTNRFPDLCEGHAILAGMLSDLGRTEEARQVAQPLLAAADGDDARGSALRCAATAAAALGDGDRLAVILQRIITREEWLRTWSFSRFGQTGRLLLMGHIYPWDKAVGLPPVVAARERMDAALAQGRDLIRKRLGPIAYK